MAAPAWNVQDEGATSPLRFEVLLSDISTRFLKMNPREVDAEIDGALSKICEFFDANMCGLFRVTPQARELLLSHVAVTADVPVLPPKTDYAPRSPWRLKKVLQGEVILVNSLDELPGEAEVDRRSSVELGIQAYLSIPVSIEGATRHALHIAFTKPGPASLGQYIPRLKVFAEILATALERNRAIVAREEAEVRLELAGGLAGAGMWDLDLTTNRFWGTTRARELYGVSEGDTVTLERLFGIVHPDDVEPLKHALKSAFEAGTTLHIEYRVVLPGGVVRWLGVRGARSPKSFGAGEHFLGVSVDITERKIAEEEAKRAHEEIKRLKDLLEIETRYLRKEVGLTQSHKEIVGKSDAIKAVLRQVEQVAATDSTVLIVGETGTGKELVARAIHSLGGRKDRLLVKVDCASLPSTLIESELFGRERGAYTGAMTRQIGRFQLADKGTIFLDEIGELSRETQAKLLRVLQEGCFEVLGSPRTVTVDVRVIAATNRDLEREVKEGRFREDLYYRLKVFPIEVPPLRDRRDDIPMLVWSFVEKFSREMRKEIRRIPKETMEAMARYHWPGNVRELRNLIEQAFILSQEDVLLVRMPGTHALDAVSAQTLEENERQFILRILDKTSWRIKGVGGAASLLSLNPSTLYSKMKKLGIPSRHKKDGMSS